MTDSESQAPSFPASQHGTHLCYPSKSLGPPMTGQCKISGRSANGSRPSTPQCLTRIRFKSLASWPPDVLRPGFKGSLLQSSLAAVSQPIYAFEWTDPEGSFLGQLTWTRLPQGFKPPHPPPFDEALSQDLTCFRQQYPEVVATTTEAECSRPLRTCSKNGRIWGTAYLLGRPSSVRLRPPPWDMS